MNYLLDTCVLSELIKPFPNRGVVQWIQESDAQRLFLSVLTFGELYKGVEKLQEGEKFSQLKNWIELDLTERFKNKILPIDDRIAISCGKMLGQQEKKGIKLSVVDALIAATAEVHKMTIVTRNTKDLERCSVEIENPWV